MAAKIDVGKNVVIKNNHGGVYTNDEFWGLFNLF